MYSPTVTFFCQAQPAKRSAVSATLSASLAALPLEPALPQQMLQNHMRPWPTHNAVNLASKLFTFLTRYLTALAGIINALKWAIEATPQGAAFVDEGSLYL